MESLFEYKYSFNADIGGWDVSKVTNMESMFEEATAFNQAIGNWTFPPSHVRASEASTKAMPVSGGSVCE